MATLSLTSLLCVPAGTLTCFIDSGEPVDWFVVYKLPGLQERSAGAQTGLCYKYLDEGSGVWHDGTGSINSLEGAVGRNSLLLLYRNTSQFTYFTMTNHLMTLGRRTLLARST